MCFRDIFNEIKKDEEGDLTTQNLATRCESRPSFMCVKRDLEKCHIFFRLCRLSSHAHETSLEKERPEEKTFSL